MKVKVNVNMKVKVSVDVLLEVNVKENVIVNVKVKDNVKVKPELGWLQLGPVGTQLKFKVESSNQKSS